MSDIFFTSDLHLNHNKGFIYEPRGFSNCHEHSLGIIDNINQVVKEDDELYILGDVMLEDDEKDCTILTGLNVTIFILFWEIMTVISVLRFLRV